MELPEGEYYQDIDDMTINVLGGEVTIRRTWYQGKWFFNRAWESLKFEKFHSTKVMQGETYEYVYVLGAERNEDIYEPPHNVISGLRYSGHCIQLGGNIQLDYYSDPVWVSACYEKHYGMFEEVGYSYALNGQTSSFEVGETMRIRTVTI